MRTCENSIIDKILHGFVIGGKYSVCAPKTIGDKSLLYACGNAYNEYLLFRCARSLWLIREAKAAADPPISGRGRPPSAKIANPPSGVSVALSAIVRVGEVRRLRLLPRDTR